MTLPRRSLFRQTFSDLKTTDNPHIREAAMRVIESYEDAARQLMNHSTDTKIRGQALDLHEALEQAGTIMGKESFSEKGLKKAMKHLKKSLSLIQTLPFPE